MEKEKTKDKNLLRNYIIIAVVCIFTIVFAFYLRNCYKDYEAYHLTIPVIRNTLTEMNSSELDHYVQENYNVIVYIGIPTDQECRSFEKELATLVKKYELKDYLIYLNLENQEKAKSTIKEINLKYASNQLKYYPAILIFEEGSVSKILQGSAVSPLSIKEVEGYFDSMKEY